MAPIPDNHAVASGFVAAKAAATWQRLRDVGEWPSVFPEWIASIVQDDERFTATGPEREKFDLYPHFDDEQLALDVEVVDELGSADTLRLRVLDMPGGSLVIASHGRLSGTSDKAWADKREGVQHGLTALSVG